VGIDTVTSLPVAVAVTHPPVKLKLLTLAVIIVPSSDTEISDPEVVLLQLPTGIPPGVLPSLT
jgi:hypothetical protein